MAKTETLCCKSCGYSLKIPKNFNGIITCPACKCDNIIEDMRKNATRHAKEDINSGIPLTASVVKLHNTVLHVLTSEDTAPLDVLDKTEIIKEEHWCIPAFLFYCNATAYYNYEAGNQGQRQR